MAKLLASEVVGRFTALELAGELVMLWLMRVAQFVRRFVELEERPVASEGKSLTEKLVALELTGKRFEPLRLA